MSAAEQGLADAIQRIGILENAVTAFQGLLQGRNRGKLLVRVAPDPTRD